MKSFRKFITEKREEGAFPVSDADKKKLQRQARPETSSLSSERIRRGLDTARKPLSSDEIIGAWKSAKAAKPSVVATSSKPESGVYFGSSKEAIKTAQEQEKRQQVRDTIAKNPTASAELQAAQSSGPKETMVGKGAKSGTGETYRANRPSETKATGVPSKKGRISGSLSKGNLKFSGDAAYREKLKGMSDAPKRRPRVGSPVATTKVVNQADVSKEIARKQQEYKGEKSYQTLKKDQDVRRSFPTGKGGLKADESNPYVKREVRQARASKLGGNPFDMPKGTNRPFKGLVSRIKSATKKTSYPSFFEPTKPSITKKTVSTKAPDRSATKQAISNLRTSEIKAKSTTFKPNKAITHGTSAGGEYLSPEMRKAAFKNRNVSAVTVYKPPKAPEKPPKPPSKLETGLSNIKKELEATRTQSQSAAQISADATKNLEKSVKKQFSDINKSKISGRIGAAGVLSALGAAQEFKVGQEKAKREGYGKVGQIGKGAARAAGAFLGGVGGTAIGGKVAGGVGAIGGGAYGYAKGAEFGSKAFDAVSKTSQGKWLAKKARQLVPGAFT